MTALPALKADQARIWGSASWQHIAERQLFPVHDELIARLGPRPDERWLDLATGTGAVALRAARAGGEVTGQDLAPELIETARDLAAQDDLRVDFEVGDAERLDYPDASFDVVSSAHGVVHAYDHRAVANELARVCRPGGRLGLTYWLPNPELQALLERVCPWTGDSGAAMWTLLIESDGPARAGVASLSAAERDALKRDWVDYFERHRTPGGISAPRPYLFILGRRRTA